jgi:hypothetical protein
MIWLLVFAARSAPVSLPVRSSPHSGNDEP